MNEEPMPLYPYLEIERAGGILRVWLARPELRNAFNAEMIDSLRRCFVDAAELSDIRVIVLSGRGTSFCAGADLKWMRAALEWTWEQNVADARNLAEVLGAIERCPKPVVARVNGPALGGGVGLIAACDIAISIQEARFAFSEVRLGIIPALVSPFVIRKIGQGQARALFVTGDRFTPNRAREIGLLHEIVAAEDLDRTVDETVSHILQAGPRAVEEAKALALGILDLDPEAANRYTAEKTATLRCSDEGQEGMRAFLERRPPKWIQS